MQPHACRWRSHLASAAVVSLSKYQEYGIQNIFESMCYMISKVGKADTQQTGACMPVYQKTMVWEHMHCA